MFCFPLKEVNFHYAVVVSSFYLSQTALLNKEDFNYYVFLIAKSSIVLKHSLWPCMCFSSAVQAANTVKCWACLCLQILQIFITHLSSFLHYMD